jgi:glycosyltransferase involved in cell wall biosynthesis
MSSSTPRISIGLPVYNGEIYLEEKLRSIRAQTFTDYVLVISDNASTDRTSEICQDYAAQDSRIRYFRNEFNLGLAPNFNRAFRLAPRTDYFGWTSCDDLVAPEFYQKCVDVLDNDPATVLVQSWVKLIDSTGKFVADYDSALLFPTERSNFPHERFRDAIMIPHLCLDDLGLIRSNVLTMDPVYESHFGADRNLIAELILIGKFFHIPEYLFYWRDTRARDLPFDNWSERLDASKAHRIPMPRWSMLFGYIRSVCRVEMTRREQFLCYLHITEWIFKYMRGLGKDIFKAGGAVKRRLERYS